MLRILLLALISLSLFASAHSIPYSAQEQCLSASGVVNASRMHFSEFERGVLREPFSHSPKYSLEIAIQHLNTLIAQLQQLSVQAQQAASGEYSSALAQPERQGVLSESELSLSPLPPSREELRESAKTALLLCGSDFTAFQQVIDRYRDDPSYEIHNVSQEAVQILAAAGGSLQALFLSPPPPPPSPHAEAQTGSQRADAPAACYLRDLAIQGAPALALAPTPSPTLTLSAGRIVSEDGTVEASSELVRLSGSLSVSNFSACTMS